MSDKETWKDAGADKPEPKPEKQESVSVKKSSGKGPVYKRLPSGKLVPE